MGSTKDPGACPRCGEEADFAVMHDATDSQTFEVPDEAEGLVAHYDPGEDYYDPSRPTTYYFHWELMD